MAVQRSASQEKKTKSFNFRLSSLVAACFLILAAVVLAYVGGVMSGRAFSERQMAEREKQFSAAAVVPAQDHSAAASTPDAAALQGQNGPEGHVETGQAHRQILAAEDLRFASALRNELGAEMEEPLPRAEAQQADSQTVKQGSKQAEGGQMALPSTAPFAPAVDPARMPPASAQTPAPLAGQLYDFVFQVGAFKDEESVDALRQRLEGRGLRTRMKREGKLLVVLVLLRGTEERAAEIPRITKELRLGEPFLRSKKATINN